MKMFLKNLMFLFTLRNTINVKQHLMLDKHIGNF